MTSRHLTCVSCQCRCWDDGFILAEVWALPHIVFESALGLVAMQGSGVVFRVEAVVWRYPLQAAEWRLAAPWLGQSVTALKALDALKGVLATKLTWDGRTSGNGKGERIEVVTKEQTANCTFYSISHFKNSLIKPEFVLCMTSSLCLSSKNTFLRMGVQLFFDTSVHKNVNCYGYSSL